MFGGLRQASKYIGDLAGIPLFVHWSVVVLAVFAFQRVGGSVEIGILVLISLLIGIVLHELGHGLTARACGARGLTITLWAMGGLCESRRDSSRLGHEILIVAAGPAVSAVLWGVGWWLLDWLAHYQPGLVFSAEGLTLLGKFLAVFWQIQLMLLIFNLLPIYPLDGGQLTYLSTLAVSRDQLLARQVSLFLAVFGALAWICWATGLVDLYIASARDPIGQWLQAMARDPWPPIVTVLFMGFLLRSAFLYLR